MPRNQTIALDIGGTRIKMGLVEDERILKTATLPSYSDGLLRDRLDDIESALRELTGNCFSPYMGIGIAMPCLVDPKRNRATEIYRKFEDAPTLDVEAWAKDRFGLPIVMEQDSKAALLGEVQFGVAKGFRDALLVIMGTGVGTAVMLDGTLMDSRNHSAGSLGSHLVIRENGRKCSCNSRGCLEAYTSSWALPGLLREHPDFANSVLAGVETPDFQTLEKAVAQNDPVAQEVLKTVTGAMRAGIVSLIHAYDPEAVILSGGPLNMGEVFTVPLLENIHEQLWGKGRSVAFLIADQPDQSVLLGLHHLMSQAAATGEIDAEEGKRHAI